jgi:ribosomal protein L3 glutamine methyltransferase
VPRKPRTVGDWLQWAERQYARKRVALGQVATTAHDEALYLLLHTLGLPLASRAGVLRRKLTEEEAARVGDIFRRRLVERVPAAYLTREAWLGPHRFYVDERVLIPRSYFVEIIPQLAEWLDCGAGFPNPAFGCGLRDRGAKGVGRAECDSLGGCPQQSGRLRASAPANVARFGNPALQVGKSLPVKRVADVCTGSGCLAILLAHQFREARVDAIELSPGALTVAKFNVARHHLAPRVRLYRSDVFDAVPRARYDLILSNPPYVPARELRGLPAEFRHEPVMALDGGRDGLEIIRKLLRQARDRLRPHGLVVLEVGGLRAAMEREFSALEPQWLPTTDGEDCVCLIQAHRIRAWRG